MNNEPQRFVERARASLDARSQQLSPSLEGRLRAVRRHALASSGRTPSFRLWLPAMATVALVVVVVTLSWLPRQTDELGISLADMSDAAADFEMLTRDEPLEFYQDLDFYYWLEQGEQNAG